MYSIYIVMSGSTKEHSQIILHSCCVFNNNDNKWFLQTVSF